MRTLLPVLSLALALVFPAWPAVAADSRPAPGSQPAPGPLAVTVSIPPQRYFVEKIGGDAVTVTVMAGKGQDPHSYEPTAAQMEGITRAAVYFAIGVPFETQWLPRFRDLNPGLDVVDLPRAVDRIAGKPDLALRDALPGRGRHGREGHGHGLETDDPHIWLSPDAMLRTVPLMTAALAAKRPEMAAVFERRGAELATEISGLNARIRGLFAPIPGEKLFLTFHQSWAYYARNFGLREVSVELDGREPGPKSMALLMDFARANRIRVIVAGAMTGKSAVRAIADSLGAEIVIADTLAENWPAALLEFSENLASAMAR